jgi:hypothetical protein
VSDDAVVRDLHGERFGQGDKPRLGGTGRLAVSH